MKMLSLERFVMYAGSIVLQKSRKLSKTYYNTNSYSFNTIYAKSLEQSGILHQIYNENKGVVQHKTYAVKYFYFHTTQKMLFAHQGSHHITNSMLYRKWQSNDNLSFKYQLLTQSKTPNLLKNDTVEESETPSE